MSEVTLGSSLNNSLQNVLMVDDIAPGSQPSYQACKEIYLYHPLGGKLVETPIKIAQSQQRIITVGTGPEEQIRQAFIDEWERIKADYHIAGTMYQARIYGVGAIVVGAVGVETNEPVDPWQLAEQEIYFSVLDPLNTAGSLVLDQNPNSPMFQKSGSITAAGQPYHRSRACVMFNGHPIYLAYISSAFGFSGQSVFQRALYPLKSFVRSMITDDMVTTKAGLIVAMLKNAGSIINSIMQKAAGIKRALLREAQTNNVLSIDVDEKIETLNMQNADTAMTTARSNIIKNIATAADTPAQMLEDESFAKGFGEGTEDAKNLIRFVNGVRRDMQPLYAFFDKIVQHRAWSREFFNSIAAEYPDLYAGRQYEEVFYEWRKAFKAEWPSLLEEPESEQSKLEKVKLEGMISLFEALSAKSDPDNYARLVEWVMNNANDFKKLFKVDMTLDIDAIREFADEQQQQQKQQQQQQPEMQEQVASATE
jgi:hypothetical protein